MSSTNIPPASIPKHMASFGGRLKAARLAMFERFGMEVSQQDLADYVGFTRGAISAWEGGKYEPPRETVGELGRVLHVTVPWLREGVGDRSLATDYVRPVKKPPQRGREAAKTGGRAVPRGRAGRRAVK